MKSWCTPIAIVLSLACSGCTAGPDPYDRPGMWRPQGANAGNIAAMVERPSDLVRGRGERSTERFTGQDAVLRYWQDRARPLPNSSSSSTSVSTAANGKDTP